MTAKKEVKKEETEVKKKNSEKKILAELVLNSDVPFTKIVLELSRKGLLKQFEEEVVVYGKADLKPSITEDEFNKILDGR